LGRIHDGNPVPRQPTAPFGMDASNHS
jgi:hypothetical protein